LIRFEFNARFAAREAHKYPNWNESSKTVQYEPIGELGFPIHLRLAMRAMGRRVKSRLEDIAHVA